MAEHEAALDKKASLTVIPMLQKRKPVKCMHMVQDSCRLGSEIEYKRRNTKDIDNAVY